LYLPFPKEEVDKIAENKKTLIVFCIVLIFVFAFGWLLCRYYDSCAREDSANVVRTVQSVKDDNQRARENIGAATEQLTITKQSLTTADSSLSQASEVLNRQSQSLAILTEQINSMTKKEARLTRQRDTWAVAAGALLVGLAMK